MTTNLEFKKQCDDLFAISGVDDKAIAFENAVATLKNMDDQAAPADYLIRVARNLVERTFDRNNNDGMVLENYVTEIIATENNPHLTEAFARRFTPVS